MEFVKKVVALAILCGLGFYGYQKYGAYQEQRKAGEITVEKLAQLQPGMTREQVEALLGRPGRVTSGGSIREGGIDKVGQATQFVYYRGDTVMLCFNAQNQLIEVSVGEGHADYYTRQSGEKPFWQNFPPEGFIHNESRPPKEGPITPY